MNTSNEIVRNLSDRVNSRDQIRTEIMAGYNCYRDARGISHLGEVVIRHQHNKVVIGGALEIIRKMFGVDTDLTIKTLNDIMGIGTTGVVNDGAEKQVCLFNVGLGGCGSAYTDKKVTLDQENQVKEMIPFRIVDDESELGDNVGKYWFAKQLETGKTAYYMKKFESISTIKSLWKDASSTDEDGTEVVGDPSTSTRPEGIESFVEIVLRISAEDLREYFNTYDSAENARFNSIGLCMGQMGTLEDGTPEYKNVTQFSILNFSNEMLHFDKDLSIIYRVYIS